MTDLSALLKLWEKSLQEPSADPAVIAFDFILFHGQIKYGDFWLGSSKPTFKASTISDMLTNNLSYLHLKGSPRAQKQMRYLSSRSQLLRSFQLKGVREDSHLGLLGWLDGRYPLKVRPDRPSPLEMLHRQCQGERFATIHLGDDEQFTPIGRHAGAYEFLLHDLEHAEKFFGSTHAGQVHFFKLIRAALEKGHFQPWQDDEKFNTDFDYLISDMNSHPVHLLKYLKAIALEACRRNDLSDAFLEPWWQDLLSYWALPSWAREAAEHVNTPRLETEADRIHLSRFFMENASGI